VTRSVDGLDRWAKAPVASAVEEPASIVP
jgi:hypothetical protein